MVKSGVDYKQQNGSSQLKIAVAERRVTDYY